MNYIFHEIGQIVEYYLINKNHSPLIHIWLAIQKTMVSLDIRLWPVCLSLAADKLSRVEQYNYTIKLFKIYFLIYLFNCHSLDHYER